MSRQAFEEWAGEAGYGKGETDDDFDYPLGRALRKAWQAATAAALELAAEVCDGINADYTARYVAAGATRPNNLDFLDGASDGAEECAAAIRALKEDTK